MVMPDLLDSWCGLCHFSIFATTFKKSLNSNDNKTLV